MAINQFNPKRTSSNIEQTLEYTLACGHLKRRKTVPPATIGEVSHCWDCGGLKVIVERNVVLIKRR